MKDDTGKTEGGDGSLLWLKQSLNAVLNIITEGVATAEPERQPKEPAKPPKRPLWWWFLDSKWGIVANICIVCVLWTMAAFALAVPSLSFAGHWSFTLVRIVWLCALIGGATNKLAVYMLFYPREPCPRWRWWPKRFRLQGLMFKFHKELARAIGTAVSDYLLNEENIRRYLQEEWLTREKVDVLTSRLEAAIRKFGEELDSEAGREALGEIVRFIGEQIVKNREALERMAERAVEYLRQRIRNESILVRAGVWLWEKLGGDLEGKVQQGVEEVLQNMDKFVKDIKGRLLGRIADGLAKRRDSIERFAQWLIEWLPRLVAKAAARFPIAQTAEKAVLRYDLEHFKTEVIDPVAGRHLRFIVLVGWGAGALAGVASAFLRLGLNL